MVGYGIVLFEKSESLWQKKHFNRNLISLMKQFFPDKLFKKILLLWRSLPIFGEPSRFFVLNVVRICHLLNPTTRDGKKNGRVKRFRS